ESALTFPNLHKQVLSALSGAISPRPWFNKAGSDNAAIDDYSTNVRGRFRCANTACRQAGWGSGRVAILIRHYPRNGYNAVVFNQRCKSCERLGVLTLDEQSYVDRVAYRLKKWAGVKVERPPYAPHRGPEHEEELCEGCKRGVCR
ncbi:hypothetical protein N656DRAFT_683079, partial [Canariomyces notabilis]